MRERLLRLWTAALLRLSLVRLERGVAERDLVPLALFLGSFGTYWTIGQLIQSFHGHDVYNYFFNADCPRIVTDLTRAQRSSSSGIAVSSVHPLFLILWNPVAAALSRALGGDELLASLLLSHAVAALGNVLSYVTLRKLAVGQALAVACSACLALSTAQLVFGSITETYSFALCGLLACVAVSLFTTRPAVAALAHVVPFGVNVVLAPHSLLAAPVLWVGKLAPLRWISRILIFWVLVLALALVLLKLQHERYPDTNFFHRSYFEGYLVYSEKPADLHRYVHRWERLVPHLFSFEVVAPVSLFTGAPEKITTFMWEGRDRVARYSPFGGFVAVLWLGAILAAAVGNVRGFLRRDRARTGLRLLVIGWLAGVFGLFTYYGDDLMLYSELWVGHVVLFVGVGLAEFFREEHARRWRAGAAVFLSLLAWNNFRFVAEMLARYGT